MKIYSINFINENPHNYVLGCFNGEKIPLIDTKVRIECVCASCGFAVKDNDENFCPCCGRKHNVHFKSYITMNDILGCLDNEKLKTLAIKG